MGLGLKIKTDETKRIARISEVIKGKAASLAKNVREGDRIISANGVYLVGKSHDEVIQAMLMKTPDGIVTLELVEDSSPLHNPGEIIHLVDTSHRFLLLFLSVS